MCTAPSISVNTFIVFSDTAQPKETKTKANDGPPLLLWWDPIDGTKDHNLRCGTLSCSVSVDRSRLKERDIMVRNILTRPVLWGGGGLNFASYNFIIY